MTIWSRAARLIIRAVFAALFRTRVVGVLPSRGPVLVVANHQGWADGFLIAAAFPLRAPIRFLGDRDGTMAIWWHRLLLRSLGIVIPIDRTRTGADRAAIAATLEALRGGGIVVIFAEGTVSRAERTLGPFARGIGYLALRSGAPVLPLWLAGTAELYLGRELVLVAGTPRVVSRDAPTKEATLAVARAIHDDLADLDPGLSDYVGPKPLRWLTDLF